MIKSIQFRNFKALRDTTLPLGRFTLIVGANGSGKSTAMQALAAAGRPTAYEIQQVVTASLAPASEKTVDITITWGVDGTEVVSKTYWRQVNHGVSVDGPGFPSFDDQHLPPELPAQLVEQLLRFRIFSFDPQAIATPVQLEPQPELASNGSNLAAVLDDLRDRDPERFEALNQELGRWLPEFDRILFETPSQGTRAFLLRTRAGHHPIRAADLSQGTLFMLAFLTLAYVPNHPPIVCFEEPERGIHPRLLHEIQEGMYRLAYPESFGETRSPVQVIAITHSPYLLDLYRDHPEEVVIAHKAGPDVRFEHLSETAHVNEILEGAPLGEVWYSGILGGVPAAP